MLYYLVIEINLSSFIMLNHCRWITASRYLTEPKNTGI
nr:hypothetical protein CJLB15_00030 [Campylobacter phage CJLB-15]